MQAVEIKMHRIDESQALIGMGYDGETRTLAVLANGGTLYHYANVEPDVWLAFRNASSKGKFWTGNIVRAKEGDQPKYPCTKIGSGMQMELHPPEAPVVERPQYIDPGMTIEDMVLHKKPGPELVMPKKAEQPAPAPTLSPINPFAILVQTAPDANIEKAAGMFEGMLVTLSQGIDDHFVQTVTELLELKVQALAVTVTSSESAESAAAIGRQLADRRRAIERLVKPTKQSIDRVKDVFLDKEKELVGIISEGEDFVSKAITAWRKQEFEAAKVKAAADAAAERKRIEEQRLAEAQKATDAGKPALANALLNAPISAPVAKVEPQKVAGAKAKVKYTATVIDISQLPWDWLMANMPVINSFARERKLADGTIVDGVQFNQVEDTDF